MIWYNIPFHQRSSLKPYVNVVSVLFSIITVFDSVIIFIGETKENFVSKLLIGMLFLVLGLISAYIFIFGQILKKFYIEMTSEYLKVFLPFKSKKVYWKDIYDAELYDYNNKNNKNNIITVLLERDKDKRTILGTLDSLYGVPQYSFKMPLSLFNNVDEQKLMYTMQRLIEKAYKNDKANIEILNESYEKDQNSVPKALATAILICALFSIIYGITMYKLQKNYVAIPILGCFFIIVGFNRFYLETEFSLKVRLLLGLICFLQVPAAVVGSTIMSDQMSVNVSSILYITCEYFNYLIHNPLEQIAFIIVSIICFVLGAFQGRKRADID